MPLIDLSQTNAYESAALPGEGDVSAGGGGLTTSSLTNEADLASYGLDTYTQSVTGGSGGGSRQKVVDSSGNVYDAYTGSKVGKAIGGNLHGNPQAEHPFWTILLLLIVLGLMKFIPKEEHEESKPIKIGFNNGIRITIMGMLGFLFAKFFFGVILIPSVSPTIEGV